MSDLIKRKSIRNLYSCLNPEDKVRVAQVLTDIDAIPSARPKGEWIAIGAVCEVICKHCIKANGYCQHHWKCPLLTEIAELMEPKDEPQTDGYMTAEQTVDYRKMLDNAENKVYGNIFEDEPQTETSTNNSTISEKLQLKDKQSGKE